MKGWFQTCDYESQDYGEVSVAEAEQLIRECDWDAHRKAFEDALEAGADACPPGLGVTADNKAIYHIHVDEPDQWSLDIHLPREGRFLGIIPKPLMYLTVQLKSLDEAIEMLRLFYEDRDELKRRLRRLRAERRPVFSGRTFTLYVVLLSLGMIVVAAGRIVMELAPNWKVLGSVLIAIGTIGMLAPPLIAVLVRFCYPGKTIVSDESSEKDPA